MTKHDIHQEITDKIIELLEKVNPDNYEPPFAGLASQGMPLNPTTEKSYNGVNILALWFNQQAKNFPSNQWATFKQWKEEGAKVKKGEKASRIIFYKTLKGTTTDQTGEEKQIDIPMMRYYHVFNASQVEGYEHIEGPQPPKQDLVENLDFVDQFCSATKADIRHSDTGRAFYQRKADYIQMPETKLFLDTQYSNATENYYSTLLHELTHWTGAPHRLDRDKAKTKNEVEKIAFEELIAELGAAFLCASLGIKQIHPTDHAIYIKGWLQALKNDKSFIFKAAAKAGQAADFLNDFQYGLNNV